MEKFTEGQRWISETEPELGLGTITGIEARRIHVSFYGSQCERLYTIAAAPVKRVRFKPGDEITSRHDLTINVETVKEIEGIIIYYGDGHELHESDLSDTLSFSTPKDRLMNGMVDSNAIYNLRCAARDFRSKANASPVRGFVGGRVDLVPHQFYIAEEVSSRHVPRILLSDEVGLGKTIEAALILHRLLLCERIGRVLILVPDSLVHQWFVELYRKFSLLFKIFNADYCTDAEQNDVSVNPFLEDQLGICSVSFARDPRRKEQILAAGWDMLVIDEAHHLVENSPDYLFVERLGQKSNGMMLLTATPEQLGERIHFAHLRLLDPARYYCFDDYLKSTHHYQVIAEFIDRINQDKPLAKKDLSSTLFRLSGNCDETMLRFRKLICGTKQNKKQLIDELLDHHGTGRIIFRNTRATIKGFPGRREHIYPLTGSPDSIRNADQELMADIEGLDDKAPCNYSHDPRIPFLVDLLHRFKGEKVLVICRSIRKTLGIESALKQQINIKTGLFNEKMTLIQRDRSAAWFSEKNGAQLMICSEIGSEGRNFQFAHHLVLFDLPLNPELMEQRMGRLDRIGQTEDIHIHVPYLKNSTSTILVNWYSKGLGLFENNVRGVHHSYKKFCTRIIDLVHQQTANKTPDETALHSLVEDTRNYSKALSEQLEKGRDRLLEMNSFKSGVAVSLINEIITLDKNRNIDDFMLNLFDYYGITADDAGYRTYRLRFNAMNCSGFPLPAGNQTTLMVTFDRQTALSREDIDFLSQDHPMVTGAVELLLGSGAGNSCLAVWHDSGKTGILLEAYFVPECVAPRSLHIDRFLPDKPVRVVVDHSGHDLTPDYSPDLFSTCLESLSGTWLAENQVLSGQLLPGLVHHAQTAVEPLAHAMIDASVNKMETAMQSELQRLKNLKKVNPSIREEEIVMMAQEIEDVRCCLNKTSLRLDALRLILLK
ncbi:MAG: RNA polymerase-associated protein RapA [Proteobacteria bacterium]|nr:RNA polymerase-associated protein RapA [Pseudomonadota bacterium]